MTSHPSFDIVGIGAATVDILALVDRFPAGDSVQQAHARAICGGGPVATALCTASQLGFRTALIDSIGDDWAGAQILAELGASNVNTSFVEVSSERTSALSSILVRRSDAARAIAFTPASAPPPSVSPQACEAIASAEILHINGRHPEACRQAIPIAQQYGTKISFDGGAGRFSPEIASLLHLSAIIIVSRNFAECATGRPDPSSAAAQLACLPTVKLAVVTDGIHGSWLADGESPLHCPAFAHPKTIDTTGAGDVFHGAFLASLLGGNEPPAAQKFAAAAAALSTLSLGGRAAIPSKEAIASLLSHSP